MRSTYGFTLKLTDKRSTWVEAAAAAVEGAKRSAQAHRWSLIFHNDVVPRLGLVSSFLPFIPVTEVSIIFLERVVFSSHRETDSRCGDTINKAPELVAKDVVGILSVNTRFSVTNNSH